MATISSLTELTSADSGDLLALDDVSAGVTKKITVGNLASVATGAMANLGSDAGGTVITLSSLSTTYTDITTYSDEATDDYGAVNKTAGTVTLPAGTGTYLIMYAASAQRTTGSTSDIYIQAVADGTHIPGSESHISSDGTSNDAHSQSAITVYAATGGEVIKLQAKIDSGTTTVTVDNVTLVVLRIGF